MTEDDQRPELLPAETKGEIVNKYEQGIIEEFFKAEGKKYGRFTLAVLSSIPWIGGILSAIAALDSETSQGKVNDLQRLWLHEHQEKIKELGTTIHEILVRLDSFGPEVQQRIESPEYLTLVRRTFTAWDQADTQDKRNMYKRLITNAGAITLCPDDLVRLFISWIEQHHEAHFAVIKEVYQNPGISRGDMWDRVHPEGRPTENSAEADLFRYLIRDLSMGGVIRQERETNASGQFMRRESRGHSSSGHKSTVMESAFEDSRSYELTELGKQFVHYVMEDVVAQIEG